MMRIGVMKLNGTTHYGIRRMTGYIVHLFLSIRIKSMSGFSSPIELPQCGLV